MSRFLLLLLPLHGCLQYRETPEGPATDGETSDSDPTLPTDTDDTPPDPVAPVEDGLVYELYVRSFQDSDGDGIGDLAGLRSRLDHLAELGVTVVWLMPTFESASVSGYATTDYLAVEPDYGDDADFEALTADAAALGIRIVLDVPLNNASHEHPGFVEAAADRASDWRSRFVFSDTRNDTERWFPTPAGDYYYAFFSEDQPDFDWTDAATFDDFEAVVARWAAAGVGGWRADAVRQLVEEDGVISDAPASHEVMAWFVATSHAAGADFVISEAYYPDDIEGVLAYLGPEDAPEADVVIDAPRANIAVTALADGSPDDLRTLLDTEIAAGAERRVLSFLSSHDTDRLPVRVATPAKRRLLQVLNFTLPGLPMLYYGEELDLDNGDPQYRQDEPQRTPMLWDTSPNAGFTTGTPWFNLVPGWEALTLSVAREDPDSMFSLVLALSTLRRASEALRSGALTWVDADPDLLVYTLGAGTSTVTVAANFGVGTVDPPAVDGCLLTPDGPLGPAGYALWGSAELCSLLVPGNP